MKRKKIWWKKVIQQILNKCESHKLVDKCAFTFNFFHYNKVTQLTN